MVRILKVKELEEQRRAAVARSEMYRQTLKLEVADIKSAATLLKRRFGVLQTSSRLLRLVVPLAGMFFFRRSAAAENPRNGFLARLFMGLKIFRNIWPVLQGKRSQKSGEARGKGFARFS